MKRPKVLLIHEKIGLQGGAEQSILLMLSYLHKEVDFCFLYGSSTGKKEETFKSYIKQFQTVDFETNHKKIESLTSEFIDRISPDLIFLHKCQNISILQAVFSSRKPVVRMVHDHDVYCMRSYKYFPISRKICERKAGFCCLFPCLAFLKKEHESSPLFPFSWKSFSKQMRVIDIDKKWDRYLVGSSYMMRELAIQGYPREKVSLISLSCSDFQFERSPHTDNRLFLFSGQLVRGKGLDILLTSLSLIQEDFRLIIMGDGPQKNDFLLLCEKLNLRQKVIFTGFLSQQELKDFYAKASFAVVPSVWPEPFGAVGIEFMRHGIPVIGFQSGGISDWLKDKYNGFLVPWMNVEELSKKISYLLREPQEAKRLGKNALEFAKRHYTTTSYLSDLVKIFKQFARDRNL